VKGNTQADPVVVEQVLGILRDPDVGSLWLKEIAAWLTPRAHMITVRDFIVVILEIWILVDKCAIHPD